MKKISYAQLKNHLYCVYIILIVLIATFTAIASQTSDVNDYGKHAASFSSGWVDQNGNEINLEDIQQDTTVTKSISVGTQGKSLFFRAKNINLNVYKNGDLYESHGNGELKSMSWYKTPGTYFVNIPIDPDDTEISIEILVPYSNDTSCNIKSMQIGDGIEIMRKEVQNMIIGFCTCVLIVLIGIIMCILSVSLRKYGENHSSFMSLGMFACVSGIWAAIETKFLQLTIGHTSILHLVQNSALLIMILPLFIFFRDRGEAKDKISVPLIGGLTGSGFITCFVLHFMGIKDLHETMIVAHIIIALGCAFTLYYAWRAYAKSKFKDPAFWGLFVISACSITDVILYYLQLTKDSSTFVRIGVLCYIITLGAQLIAGYVQSYSENIKADMIMQMAYFDIMTGFYNNNSFISDLKDINKHPEENMNRAVMVFDLNCLKYINDTMGHAMGDNALKEAADYIRNSLGNIGKCYRTGGDEYAVITDKIVDKNELKDICIQLQSKLEERNKIHNPEKPYPLYIAGGYAIITTNGSEAFSEADAKMYKNKQDIKDKLRKINSDYVRT